MSYVYQTERPKIFTEDGQRIFLRVRDRAKYLLDVAGAFRQSEVLSTVSGDSWLMMACVDRLVELKEVVELPRECWAQYRVFTSPKVHNL